MGALTDLFGSEDALKSPVHRLALQIVGRAAACAEEFQPIITFNTEDERQYQAMWVVLEFACFFAHQAFRCAFTALGPERRQKLQDCMGPLMAKSILGSFMTEPTSAVETMSGHFHQFMNASEQEYAGCSELVASVSDGTEITRHAATSVLARNVLELSGYEVPQTKGQAEGLAMADYAAMGAIRCRYSKDPKPMNPVTFHRIVMAAMTHLKAMSIRRLVEDVSDVL